MLVTYATENGNDLPVNRVPFDASPTKQPKADSSWGVQSKEVPKMPWQSSAPPIPQPSSSNSFYNESKYSAEVITSSTNTYTEEDSDGKSKDTTIKTSIILEKSSRKEEEQHEDARESNPENGNVKAEDPTNEDANPPPLAGANVMNVIIVAAECAPWVKTGNHYLSCMKYFDGVYFP